MAVSHLLMNWGHSDGTEKSQLSANASIPVISDPIRSVKQFYGMSSGVLIIPEDAWAECEEMYYCCSMGSELLSLVSDYGSFRAINPVEFLSRPAQGDSPCLIDQFYSPLFRIKGADPSELFCVEGIGSKGDQFKYCYDKYGFAGLEFEKIWGGNGEQA